MNSKKNIFVISAASGAGKTTVVNRLLNEDTRFARVITHTTRQKRSGEKDGIDYHFTDKNHFEDMIQNDAFIEWAKVYQNYYGTSKQSLKDTIEKGQSPLLVIEWQGAKNVKLLYPHAKFILMLPPSMQELKHRISSRGGDQDDIKQRIKLAKYEIEQMRWYDQVIINDDLDQCVNDLRQALEDSTQFKLDDKESVIEQFLNN